MSVFCISIPKVLACAFVKAKIILFNLCFSTNSPKVAAGHRFITPIVFKGYGKIIIERNVMLGCAECPQHLSSYNYIEARSKSSSVVIQESTSLANNIYICADYTSITIGKNTAIGSNVQIIDSDFHIRGNNSSLVRSQKCHSKPIVIGENVFIGNNVIILKGVTLGSNSTIGAGSVVSRDIPSNTVAAGNPARIIASQS
jgi:maltose O-acetyltransferase